MSPLLVADDAHAQEGALALDRFQPAPSGDDFFRIESYRAGDGDVDFSGMVLLEYARHPLTVHEVEDGEAGDEVAAVVSDQMVLHVGASIGFLERVQLSLDLPMAILNRGDAATADGVTLQPPAGTALGDLRAGMRLRLFGEADAPIGAAVGGYVFVPTGSESDYTSTGNVRGHPALMLGGRAGPVRWGFNTGVSIRDRATLGNTLLGTELTFGGGVALLAADGDLQIGPEVYGSTLLDKHGADGALPPFDTKDTSLEAILGIKGRIDPIVLGAGAGPGFTRGVGTAQLRALVSIAYAPAAIGDRDGDRIDDDDDACPDVPGLRTDDPATNGCPERVVPLPDRDRDGIADRDDACIDVPGVASTDPRKNGCPPDRDGDGVVDPVDACPDVPGVASTDPTRNGCPSDRDGDGILDPADACLDVPGVASTDPARNGCPLDTDGDGIVDSVDACPTEAGKPNAEPAKHGCPLAFLQGELIVITEQVQFETGRDGILPVSEGLLTSVKGVLERHPGITRLLIEGHTDNVGTAAYNQALSERRAASVRRWLVANGVAGSRLESKGFGFDRPIGDNGTDAGRQMNRRVEFKVLTGAQQPGVTIQKSGTAPPAGPPPSPGRP